MQPPFNPYSAPQYAAQPHYGGGVGPFFARVEGQNLVVSKTAFLPNVCVKCAARDRSGALRGAGRRRLVLSAATTGRAVRPAAAIRPAAVAAALTHVA